ncbi:hypothetical protein T12_7236 [Trichinella patagoniensis]|uniref:Uncharacterized protein n=1 Tax=Trichinella patagoniensis TaxID=990121 RepID=A0A0V0ZL27_9BILA|nr:hypothetical protein T12_7236 [Trichinella patagoniensis]
MSSRMAFNSKTLNLDHYPEQRSIFALGDESMRIQYEEQMSEAHFKRNTVRKR